MVKAAKAAKKSFARATKKNVASKRLSRQTSVSVDGIKKNIAVSLLDFDPENPRFPAEINSGTEEELIERFIRDERLLEVIESIANQGYFAGEPLLVVPKGRRFVVLEGNRRLAALKLLTGEIPTPEGRMSIERSVESAVHRPDEVPCIVFDRRDEILKYLGFRHITGIKAWSALQKARYAKRLRDASYSALPYDESLRVLARETGSKAPYIGQMLASLNLYEVAEKKNFYDFGLGVDDIDFSIISTAISYANIVEWLGLESRVDARQKNLNKTNLRLFFSWAFDRTKSGRSVLGDSRNLKRLAAIVASEEATQELVRHSRLEDAYELSKGPAIALLEALTAADRRLNAVWNLIKLVSAPDPDHLKRSDSIVGLAGSIYAVLESKGRSADEVRMAKSKQVDQFPRNTASTGKKAVAKKTPAKKAKKAKKIGKVSR